MLEHTAADIGYLAATMAGGVAALSPWLLRLAAGSDFRPDELVPQVAMIGFGTVLGVGYLANVHLVFATGRTAGLSLTTPLSLGAGLALGAALSQLEPGLLAMGFPLTYAGMFAGSSYLAHRVGPVRWRQQVLLAPVALGALYCAAGALLPLSLPLRLTVAALIAGIAVARLRHVVRR